MSTEVVVAVIAGVSAVIGAGFSYRASTRANAVEEDKVDAAAYERAKAIYESALKTLEEQLERMRRRLDEVTDQLTREQDSSMAMRLQIRELQAQVSTFERTVSDLRLQLSKSGIEPLAHPKEHP
ncbi:hypothetical protein Ssi03_26010 [Sphaerisporangium siamense]|uniref:Mg2+ and Co2+ transporter CorA n=1 Tax=Sphaerisporangium siamense TaxID=795645 RepID=A0A7W7G8A7_9ACTN|nr:hypothetical protein [Sphaerisporangium siamense]MBB4700072.1 Mg2+ and Co2+ transporter CorA [Sphaerisporangium siamense]GII84611.1 hypothetical protein Ssi03_26010 [Sphaerisporangium siamense]